MKTFKIIASYRTYVYAHVQAENESQAYDIAHDMDGGDFERLKGEDLSDWTIDDAIEVTA
jgi:uncharacterized membrane protein YkoI